MVMRIDQNILPLQNCRNDFEDSHNKPDINLSQFCEFCEFCELCELCDSFILLDVF